MPRVEVVPARPEHVPPIARDMRAADRAEIWATALLQPAEGLALSLATSPLAWTGLVDGRPACMFGAGAAPGTSNHGVPWLLGTDRIERHQVAFLRRNRAYVEAMQERFSILSNRVDARNADSIRWLLWLGFTLGAAVPHGPFALPFHPFWRMRHA